MIVRGLVRQSRTALFAPPLSSGSNQACRRAFLSTDATTPPPPPTPSTPPHAAQTPPAAAASQPSAAGADAAPAAPGDAPHPERLPWGVQRNLSNAMVTNYITMTKLQRKTKRLGSAVERRYMPSELIRQPPYPKDVTLELLMASQTHLGHNASLWNPANARYIHGVRAGVHIIALEQTAVHLRRAARVVEEVAYRGGLVLFAGTRPGQMDAVVRAAQLAGGYHLFTKWAPGTITNRDVILAKGGLRVLDERDRDITQGGFQMHVAEQRPLCPDLVVVLNPLENYVLLRECAHEMIPTIGLIDTDADPAGVTYAIPGNDDSPRSVALVAGVLGRAGELGQKRRLRDAKEGIVTWENSEVISRYMRKANMASLGKKAPRSPPERWALAGGRIHV